MHINAFMIMGRPGSGKGTQTALLTDTLAKVDPSRKVLHIELGAEFRRFNEGASYTAVHGKKIVDSGGLMPECIPIYLWVSSLVDRFSGDQHVIFDGSPRKLLEAQVMENAMQFFGFSGHIIYLDVHEDESLQRLILRGKTSGRKDDAHDAIRIRQATYLRETHPTVEYFRSHSDKLAFHDIDGIGTIPEVHARIVKALGLA